MSAPAVTVACLSKAYRLYAHHADRLKEALHPLRRKYHRDFYALHDVSFEIPAGQTVGIIGRNGSGKSTLLKLLTGILTPTAGRVAVNGRISALLELGAGFNPELTGRENIYFSGTIMGFSRVEMERRVAPIIAFAEIGDFIDQPVKTYSSGMFVRLAFAVAINVDPEILIIDEALAVGDISFQAKCFRKFNEFRAGGKTVIVVTHALDSVIRYCHRALVLDGGRLVTDADAKTGVDAYKQLMAGCMPAESDTAAESAAEAVALPVAASFKSLFAVDPHALSYGDRRAEIYDFGLFDAQGRAAPILQHGQPFTVKMKVRFLADLEHPIFAFTLKDLKGLEITGTNTYFKQRPVGPYRAGDAVLVEFAQTLNCQSGRYALSLGCTGFERENLVVYHRLYDILLLETVAAEPMVGFYDLGSRIDVTQLTTA